MGLRVTQLDEDHVRVEAEANDCITIATLRADRGPFTAEGFVENGWRGVRLRSADGRIVSWEGVTG